MRKEFNEMRIPGFTAEASLYERRELYQGAANQAVSTNGQVVIPQRPPRCICESCDADRCYNCLCGG